MLIKEVKNALKHFRGMKETVALANDWNIAVDLRARFFVELVDSLMFCEGERYKHFYAHYMNNETYENIAFEMYSDKSTVRRNCIKVIEEIAVALEASGLQYRGWLCYEE